MYQWPLNLIVLSDIVYCIKFAYTPFWMEYIVGSILWHLSIFSRLVQAQEQGSTILNPRDVKKRASSSIFKSSERFLKSSCLHGLYSKPCMEVKG